MRRTASPLPYPPLLAAHVTAGFPSPAEDYSDQWLDLNDPLIDHPVATFSVRIIHAI